MLVDTERASCPPNARTVGRETQLEPRLLSCRRADFLQVTSSARLLRPFIGHMRLGTIFCHAPRSERPLPLPHVLSREWRARERCERGRRLSHDAPPRDA
jgi:hypothetical protein